MNDPNTPANPTTTSSTGASASDFAEALAVLERHRAELAEAARRLESISSAFGEAAALALAHAVTAEQVRQVLAVPLGFLDELRASLAPLRDAPAFGGTLGGAFLTTLRPGGGFPPTGYVPGDGLAGATVGEA